MLTKPNKLPIKIAKFPCRPFFFFLERSKAHPIGARERNDRKPAVHDIRIILAAICRLCTKCDKVNTRKRNSKATGPDIRIEFVRADFQLCARAGAKVPYADYLHMWLSNTRSNSKAMGSDIRNEVCADSNSRLFTSKIKRTQEYPICGPRCMIKESNVRTDSHLPIIYKNDSEHKKRNSKPRAQILTPNLCAPIHNCRLSTRTTTWTQENVIHKPRCMIFD